MFNAIVDILLPPICPLCNANRCALDLCAECLKKISVITGPLCMVCGAPFASKEGPDRLCQGCIDSPPPFLSARSAVLYEGTALEMIRALKYHSRFEFVKPLVRLMVSALDRWPIEDGAIVMPVPLHAKRLKERCFNQSLLIAKGVASAMSLRLDYKTLVRGRLTAPQVDLKGDERRKNVSKAFMANDTEAVKGKTVLLIDDVHTTGSTLAECARALKKVGAKTRALTIARSV